MFIHNINPILLDLGVVQIRYYGLAYVIGFIIAYFMLEYLAKEQKLKIPKDGIIDYLVYLAIGGLVGARLFYVIIYNPQYFIANPIEIPFLWKGGLSFHGGLIGAVLAGYYFAKKKKVDFLKLADLTVIPLAIAVSLGRIANFINAELVGNITNVSWCVQFPGFDGCRHPSQLYASVTILITFLILFYSKTIISKKFKPGTLAGLFVVLYATFRFIIGFFRAPDPHMTYILGQLTMGQLLGILTFIGGIAWLVLVNRTNNKKQKE